MVKIVDSQDIIDLWLDGGIYPPDAQSGKRPKFMCLKEL